MKRVVILAAACWMVSAVWASDKGVEFGSEDSAMVYSNLWAHWVYDRGSWHWVSYLPVDDAVEVWTWPPDGAPRFLAKTGPREGVIAASGAAMAEDGRLTIRGLLNPTLFALATDRPEPEFVRLGQADSLLGDYFQRRNLWLTAVSADGRGPIKLATCMGAEMPDFVTRINRLIPDETYHVSQTRTNHQKMHLAVDGDRLAVGYTFFKDYLLFERFDESPRMKRAPIRFRGHREPPESFVKGALTQTAVAEYFDGFHRLERLSWHQGKLYGFFLKGMEGYGLWACLSEPGAFLWDNNRQQDKLLALAPEEAVIGRVRETEDGRVTWTLWRRETLPRN